MIAKGSDPSGMKVQVLLPGKIAQSPEVMVKEFRMRGILIVEEGGNEHQLRTQL